MTDTGEQAPPGVDADERDVETPPDPLVAPPETDGEDEGKTFTAEIRDIDRVRSDDVPEEYPVSIDTASAVAVRLTVDGTDDPVFVVYFETPERGSDDRLLRLLALADTAGDSPSELEGNSLLLTIADGYYMPVIPDEPPRGNPHAVYGIFAGVLPSLIVAFVGIFAPGAAFIATTEFIAAWLLATFLVLPVSLYFDAWHLRTTTGWRERPRKWALMATVPGLNVLAVPLYLLARENANPII